MHDSDIRQVPGHADMREGGFCYERTGKNISAPQPHLWTSAHDAGVEFYPCICGKKYPGKERRREREVVPPNDEFDLFAVKITMPFLAKKGKARCTFINEKGDRCLLVPRHEHASIQLHEFGYPDHVSKPCCERGRIVGATKTQGYGGSVKHIGGLQIKITHLFSSTRQWGRYHNYSLETIDNNTWKEYPPIFGHALTYVFLKFRERHGIRLRPKHQEWREREW